MAYLGAGGLQSVGLVGTYPPTKCGIATFTASLARALRAARPDVRIGVVRCVADSDPTPPAPEVVARLVPGSPVSRKEAADALRAFDVAVVQHEFGIYGGPDGAEAVDLVRALDMPVVVVLHTVLRRPSPGEREIVEELAALADRLVVQSGAARTRLLEQYDVDARKVRTIPHGARLNLAETDGARDGRPLILTWGLLGRDKGIEFGIEALARLADLDPAPRYLVVGQTHPKVLEAVGEEYRESLRERAVQLGVADQVEFDGAYHGSDALLRRVREADVVLLPYRSREQVVSGVLVEAIASGKPVVATRFPHAEELLGAGSGLLVPHEDAEAIAHALRRLLTEPGLSARAAAVARRQAEELAWESVGARYLALADELRRRPRRARPLRFPAPSFEHVLRLSDRVGIFEHAKGTVPRREHGYCTDDVARALVAVLREPERSPRLERLASTYLGFLERAQLPDGRFRNRFSVEGRWLDEVGPDDSTGRALWAAGTAAVAATGAAQRARALALLTAGAGFRSPWPRANAFAVLGAVEVLRAGGEGTRAARTLLEEAASRLGRVSSDPDWPWPEPRLTYANAVLAEARIAAGAELGDERLLREGLELLEWLVGIESRGGHFSFTPVGGWAPGEPRPGFDQQPIEAGAMVDACARAFDVTGEQRWAERALGAAAWFLGANDVGVPLLDAESGGCRDGLTPDGVNENEGAESTLALVTALQQARRLQAAARRARSRSAVSTSAAPTHLSAAPYVR